MRSDDLVEIGRVGRPHGLDGAFIVERPSDDPGRFALGETVWVGAQPAKIVLARRVGGGRLAIKLDPAPERGQVLAVPRADLPAPDPDHYYVFQLVGLEAVESGGKTLGRVRDVLPGTANDNLELDDGTLVPMIEDAVESVDLEAGRIVLNPGFIL
ncbi:MAG: 16S rRNA processing protein RimM [Actinobacteria bacterium]|nr:MAG: 16S rRNA processing protein RimM [Actinomycetota bacterium]